MLILPQNKQNCKYPIHIPICSPIPHKQSFSLSHFPQYVSYILCSGFFPISERVRLLQKQRHSGHFFPSRCRVCNLIFHKDGSLQGADLQFLFPEVFSDIPAAFRYSRPGKSDLPESLPPHPPQISVHGQMLKAPAGCASPHVCYRNGTVRGFPHTVPHNPV